MVMNYKMRNRKNQLARDSLVWQDHFFIINICGGRETENMVWTCEATCKSSHAWRKVCSVCELARALVNRVRSMKIATFSSRDYQKQCCKSYVASYRENEELVISRMFSRELRQ